MGALGGLYRPTPQGYNGNPAGRGPSRQCLRPPSSPPTVGARRLVGPADWLGTEPTGRVRRGRVLPAADYCSRASNDAGLIMESWQQPRRLAGDHYCHSPSHLINGAWAPGEDLADWWSTCRLMGSHWLVGPAAPGSYRQAVVGAGFGPSVLMSGSSRQQCHAGRRSLEVRHAMAMPAPGKGRERALL